MEKNFEKVLDLRINIHIAVIVILVLSVVVSNLHFVVQLFGGSTHSASNQQIDELSRKLTELEFDRIRLSDSQNILLAVQDFYFQKNSLPNNLADLKGEGFLDLTMNLNDPETNQPYFYENRKNDFVLCIKISDGIKGMNTTSCPVSEGGAATSTPQQSAASTNNPVENNNSSSNLEIVGNASFVNVREEPTTNSKIIATVNPNDTFEFSEVRDNWYKIVVQEGIEGWVSGNYIKISQ